MEVLVVTLVVISGLVVVGSVYLCSNHTDKKYAVKVSDMTPEQKHLELVKMQGELHKYKTNHILHLILSLVGGLWLPVWFLIAQHNASKRNGLEKLIKMIN